MDAFFASVEVLDNPSLRGKPVIVGGNLRRGVVSAASYEARRYGVHSAQPVAEALRRCPHAVLLPGRIHRYREVSDTIFDILHRYTPLVECLSIDEAFLDVTGSGRLFGDPLSIAQKIKNDIIQETGLSASAGIGSSKFIAKTASAHQKPDGLTAVPQGCETAFLGPLPIQKLWGAGPAMQRKLGLLGIRTIGDIACMPLNVLIKYAGRAALQLHERARGIDDQPVTAGHTIQSIGHEETFMHDLTGIDQARTELLALSMKTAARMRKHGMSGKTVTLKATYSDFRKISRSHTATACFSDNSSIYKTCCRLLAKTDIEHTPVRLLGVSISNLHREGSQRQVWSYCQMLCLGA